MRGRADVDLLGGDAEGAVGGVELALEALIRAIPGSAQRHWELTDIEAAIVELSNESPSVAEIAARAGVCHRHAQMTLRLAEGDGLVTRRRGFG